MSYPSVTYTFANGETIDATAINQNFTDLESGFSSGTKDLNMNDATFAGSVQVDTNVSVSGNLTDTSGYVGINDNNPGYALTIDGSAYVSGSIFSYPTTGGWADVSGSYTITGLTPTTTYTYTHRRIGSKNHIAFDMTGTRDDTAFVIGLPSAAANNGVGFMGECRMVLDMGSSYQDTPTMLWVPASYSDMTVTKDFGDGSFSEHSVRIFGTFMYEE